MNKLSGIIAAPFTPFQNDNQLDLAQIGKIAELLTKNQVTGAFIGGTTGEASSLTHQEKIKLFEEWAKVKGDNLQVIAMLGGTCVEEMQELARVAQQNQLNGISILAPYYFKPDLDQLISTCAQVANSVPGLPFYYYHIPSLTGAYFAMRKFLQKGEKQIENLAGIKFTHSDLMDFSLCKMYREGKYTMLWGTDEALLSGLVAGADGAVGSTYNYAMPLYHELIKNYRLENIPEAKALQQLSVKMVEILVKYGGNAAGKGFMKLIGLDCRHALLPLKSLSENELESMREDLAQINFFDFCSKT